MFTNYVLLFILFGIIGWIIDSSYRSIIDKRWTSGTLIFFFSPIYGFGGLSLVLLFTYVKTDIITQSILGMLVLTLIELIGGIFCMFILKRRLWDYSKSRFNFLGYIDLMHSFYWLIISAIMGIIFAYFGIV